MFALVYVSTETRPFDDSDLAELADRAAEKNRQLNITGHLYYEDGAFFQYLEGGKPQVVELFESISLDQRHAIVNHLELGDRPDRLFPQWSMRLLDQRFVRQFSLENVLQGVLTTMVQPVFDPASTKAHVDRLLAAIAERESAQSSRR